ncbi:hypothetical protein PoB_005736500 [Plakobranchus ocellatus]|uniref:Uncharacterized protein n=1 Tax=Plakobranchus ocellatus TaxID=259542 RepID=A0AAV4CGK9_9GAST|nr:hypothetical protein PoB_005736500 [Plakobranchus ocellatus]
MQLFAVLCVYVALATAQLQGKHEYDDTKYKQFKREQASFNSSHELKSFDKLNKLKNTLIDGSPNSDGYLQKTSNNFSTNDSLHKPPIFPLPEPQNAQWRQHHPKFRIFHTSILSCLLPSTSSSSLSSLATAAPCAWSWPPLLLKLWSYLSRWWPFYLQNDVAGFEETRFTFSRNVDVNNNFTDKSIENATSRITNSSDNAQENNETHFNQENYVRSKNGNTSKENNNRKEKTFQNIISNNNYASDKFKIPTAVVGHKEKNQSAISHSLTSVFQYHIPTTWSSNSSKPGKHTLGISQHEYSTDDQKKVFFFVRNLA